MNTNPTFFTNPKATIRDENALSQLLASLERVIVDSNACNDDSLTHLDLSQQVNMAVFEVGNYSFTFVKEVKLIGLHALERVTIGENSFTKSKRCIGNTPNGCFHLKNCERVREVKIGRYSFADYSVCEIENVPSLEVIEMGDVTAESDNFWFASLELKGLLVL